MKKGKLITIGGAIVVLALCGYFFMGTSSKGKISFQTEKVTRNSMTDVVVATGTVEPVTKVLKAHLDDNRETIERLFEEREAVASRQPKAEER